jgi:hypothetical protein
MDTIQTVIDEYFKAFCNKDVNKLYNLYADDIILNEWNDNIFIGKEKVLDANKKLFEQFGQIEIDVTSAGITNNKSVNEIIVILDGAHVNVVDVLTIENQKIKYIMAYRGF